MDGVIKNMRKKVWLIFLAVFLSFINLTAFAITKDDIAIGGIGPGCSMDYVISVYGDPQNRIPDHSGNSPRSRYGYGSPNPTYYVEVKDSTGIVVSVINFGATGLKTPVGIGIGSSENDVRMVYGQIPKKDEVVDGNGGMGYFTQNIDYGMVFNFKNGRVINFMVFKVESE